MKLRHIVGLAAAILSLSMVACQCDSDNNQEEETPGPQVPEEDEKAKPEAGTFTFVLPDFAAKPAWEAGDQISLRGNYAPDAITITLKASDISGKTATVAVPAIPGTFCPPDWLYAAYPAEAVDFTETFTDPTTHFVPSNVPAMVAYWKDDNSFQFQVGVAAVSFSVDASGYDAVIVGGAAREDLRFDYTEATLSSEEDLYTRKPSDGYPFFTLPVAADGKYTVYVPSRISLSKGLKVWLKKGESYPLAYSYPNAVTFKVGQVLALGDITGGLAPYEGDAPEEMKMPVITKRTEYKVNLEELSGICLTADGKSLWAVGDEGQFAKVTITDEGQVTVENIHHFGNDLEGVTRDPETDNLYFCTEPCSVYRVSADHQSYTRLFKVEEASGYGNSGLEGITWYKDNTLYVGAQVGANLWRYNLDGEIVSFVSLKTVKAGVVEIGGLCYDPVNDWLWVTDSESHSLFVFSGDATTYYGKYKLSAGYNNESVTVDHARGCVWVGDDAGNPARIIRLDMDDLTRPVESR